MERSIRTPDWEWGDAQQCADFLNIDKGPFLRMVREGALPPPGVRVTRQTSRWHWRTIIAVSELLPFLSKRPRRQGKSPAAKKRVKGKDDEKLA